VHWTAVEAHAVAKQNEQQCMQKRHEGCVHQMQNDNFKKVAAVLPLSAEAPLLQSCSDMHRL